MIKLQVYFNEEYLPTKNEPQKIFYICSPSFSKWYISAPFYIGFNSGILFSEWAFVIFGFGFIWHKNWD